MLRRKSSIATSAWSLALALAAGVCQAQSIGTVTDLQGILLSRNGAGTIKILAPESSIESGDRLLTRPGAYARLTFTDRTAVILGPESELAIVQFSYSDTAQSNSAVFDFIQGRLEITAGRLGARSVDRFVLNTSIGTIAVGRATFIAGYTAQSGVSRLRGPSVDVGHFENVVYHPPTDGASRPWLLLAQNTVVPDAAGRSPGLYIQVLDGAINLTTGGGTQNVAAGQFGYTASFQQPPVILPANPGLQFTPPPSFSSTTGTEGGTSASKPGDVDCVVR
jgi:hypothetical protein